MQTSSPFPRDLPLGLATIVALVALGGCSSTSEDSETVDAQVDSGTDSTGGSGGGSAGDGGDAAPGCGDGVVDPGEQCDDGQNLTGSGCEPTCVTSCQADADCADMEPCNGVEGCVAVAAGKRCTSGAALSDGTECGSDPRLICLSSVCAPSICGDGLVDTSAAEQCEPPNTATCTAACLNIVCGDAKIEGAEECDNGTNAALSGCEPDCTLSCALAADCDDAEPCNGVETCEPVSGGARCSPGTAPAQLSACSLGYCRDAVCTPPTCGDGEVEPGETCEPPGATCSSTCQVVVCGDGIVAGAEDCDDGNALRLDGCTPSCRYESVERFSFLEIQKGPAPAHCIHVGSREGGNAFGASYSVTALDGANALIAESTNGGLSNIISMMFDLEDLSAQNDDSVRIGVLDATLDLRHPGTFTPGALDWWFQADRTLMDANDLPLFVLTPASLVGGVLNAGPSTIRVKLRVGDITHPVELLDTQVRANMPLAPAPSKPAPPPTNLRSDFTIFERTVATGTDEGLCASLSVQSLAQFPVPRQFTSGDTACRPDCSPSAAYIPCPVGEPAGPTCNSLLDVFVTGCKTTFVCATVVSPMQPDTGTDGAQPVPLTAGALNKVTTAVPTDGYSIYFKFALTRAHLTNNW